MPVAQFFRLARHLHKGAGRLFASEHVRCFLQWKRGLDEVTSVDTIRRFSQHFGNQVLSSATAGSRCPAANSGLVASIRENRNALVRSIAAITNRGAL